MCGKPAHPLSTTSRVATTYTNCCTREPAIIIKTDTRAQFASCFSHLLPQPHLRMSSPTTAHQDYLGSATNGRQPLPGPYMYAFGIVSTPERFSHNHGCPGLARLAMDRVNRTSDRASLLPALMSRSLLCSYSPHTSSASAQQQYHTGQYSGYVNAS